jgi:hypothetical protein
MELALRFNRESSWTLFTQEGFTKADLIAVIDRLKRLVQEGERRPECLKFSNVVEGLDRFEEELAMIKAEAAGLKPVDRAMTVMEMVRVREAKFTMLQRLRADHSKEDSFGLVWNSACAREHAVTLLTEIKLLNERIGSAT